MAEVGVQDYWVVLVNENAVVVHRDPTPGGYSSVTRMAGADTLSPLAMPEAVWTIDTLLGREDAPEGTLTGTRAFSQSVFDPVA